MIPRPQREDRHQLSGSQGDDPPFDPDGQVLGVDIYGATICAKRGRDLKTAMIVSPEVIRIVAVVLFDVADQDAVAIGKWHERAFASPAL